MGYGTMEKLDDESFKKQDDNDSSLRAYEYSCENPPQAQKLVEENFSLTFRNGEEFLSWFISFSSGNI
jgi:hypothetical protein